VHQLSLDKNNETIYISCNSSVQPKVIINGTLTFSGQEQDISAMVKQLAIHATLILCRYWLGLH